MNHLRGAQVGTAEVVWSTKVEAVRKVRVVVADSTLTETRTEARTGTEDESLNLTAVIEAAVCVAAVNETLAGLGVRSRDDRVAGKKY